jgi:hypothetical protein
LPLASCARDQCEHGVDAEDEHAGHCGVGQVVVRGGDDRQQRDRRVRQRDPTPARALDPHEHERDQQRPAEVQGGHRRELVGNRRRGVLRVDLRTVRLQRVHEAVLVEHPGRRQRIHDVQHESDHGHRQEPVAKARVDVTVAEHHPADEREAGREVDEHVVVVQELDQPVQPHRQVLDPVLAEHVQRLLGIDDLAGVGERRIGVVTSQVTDLLVPDEGDNDEDDLANREPAAAAEAGSAWH